jgi:hypothetical protein
LVRESYIEAAVVVSLVVVAAGRVLDRAVIALDGSPVVSYITRTPRPLINYKK